MGGQAAASQSIRLDCAGLGKQGCLAVLLLAATCHLVLVCEQSLQLDQLTFTIDVDAILAGSTRGHQARGAQCWAWCVCCRRLRAAVGRSRPGTYADVACYLVRCCRLQEGNLSVQEAHSFLQALVAMAQHWWRLLPFKIEKFCDSYTVCRCPRWRPSTAALATPTLWW